MMSLNFQLRISLLFNVGLSHNLVRRIWVVHMTLRPYQISCDIEGHVDLWGLLQDKCIFNLSLLFDLSIPNSVNSWPNHFKFSTVVVEKGTSGCIGITLWYFSIDISPVFTLGLSSNPHKQNQIDDLHLYLTWHVIQKTWSLTKWRKPSSLIH